MGEGSLVAFSLGVTLGCSFSCCFISNGRLSDSSRLTETKLARGTVTGAGRDADPGAGTGTEGDTGNGRVLTLL